jgi:antirestriction protein
MSDDINDSIKVYVGCLASYSKGYYYGKWIDLEKDCPTLESFYARVNKIIASSPVAGAKKWQIFDTTGLGGNLCDDIRIIFNALECKKNCDDINVFNAALNCCDSLIQLRWYIDNFLGFYDSKIDFFKQIFNDFEQCPAQIKPYIDFEQYARDLFYHYEFCEKTGAIFASLKCSCGKLSLHNQGEKK